MEVSGEFLQLIKVKQFFSMLRNDDASIRKVRESIINAEILYEELRMTISCLNVINRCNNFIAILEVDNDWIMRRFLNFSKKITTCSYIVSRRSKSGL